MEVRWVVDVEQWSPDDAVWADALSRIEPCEQARILRFNRGRGIVGRHNPDAKASLLGRLMLAALVHLGQSRGIIDASVDLEQHLLRTTERKPYISAAVLLDKSLNFNISHSGALVTCAATTTGIIGTDVMKVEIVPDNMPKPYTHAAVTEFFELMLDSFTQAEWAYVDYGAGAGEGERERVSPYERLEHFYVIWTLKEAYIKAVGVGLGLSLQSIEFAPSPWADDGGFTAGLRFTRGDAHAAEGSVGSRWAFSGRRVDGHVVATAVGPFREAGGSFRAAVDDVAARPVATPSAIRDAAGLPFARLPSCETLLDVDVGDLPVAL